MPNVYNVNPFTDPTSIGPNPILSMTKQAIKSKNWAYVNQHLINNQKYKELGWKDDDIALFTFFIVTVIQHSKSENIIENALLCKKNLNLNTPFQVKGKDTSLVQEIAYLLQKDDLKPEDQKFLFKVIEKLNNHGIDLKDTFINAIVSAEKAAKKSKEIITKKWQIVKELSMITNKQLKELNLQIEAAKLKENAKISEELCQQIQQLTFRVSEKQNQLRKAIHLALEKEEYPTALFIIQESSKETLFTDEAYAATETNLFVSALNHPESLNLLLKKCEPISDNIQEKIEKAFSFAVLKDITESLKILFPLTSSWKKDITLFIHLVMTAKKHQQKAIIETALTCKELDFNQEKVNEAAFNAINSKKMEELNVLLNFTSSNAQDANGDTLLHLAISNSDEKLAKILIEKNHANTKLANKKGDNAIDLALKMILENPKNQAAWTIATRILSSKKIQPKDSVYFVETLYYALHRSGEPHIEAFLNSLLPITSEAQDKNGNTLLHAAILNENIEIIEYISKNINAKITQVINKNNEKAIDLALKYAIKNKDVWSLVNKLNEFGNATKPNDFSSHIKSAFFAIERKDMEQFKLLFPFIQDYQFTQDKDGNTLLHTAILNKNQAAIDFIMEKCDPKIASKQNNQGSLAIDLAIEIAINKNPGTLDQKEAWELTRTLNNFGKKITPNKINDYIKEASDAIKAFNSEVLSLLRPFITSKQDENGDTLLHIAVKQQNIRAVEILLDEDINVDLIKSKNKKNKTALDIALEFALSSTSDANHGGWEIIVKIAECGKGHLQQDEEGFIRAASNAAKEIPKSPSALLAFSKLLDAGLPSHAVPCGRIRTETLWPLDEFINALPDMINIDDDQQWKTYLNIMSDPSFKFIVNRTTLLCAKVKPKDGERLTALFDVLKKTGANFNVKAIENRSQTPLHMAVKNKNLELVRVLLKYGAEINIKDDNGRTALHLAVKDYKNNPNPQMLNLLLSKGANPLILDNKGKIPALSKKFPNDKPVPLAQKEIENFPSQKENPLLQKLIDFKNQPDITRKIKFIEDLSTDEAYTALRKPKGLWANFIAFFTSIWTVDGGKTQTISSSYSLLMKAIKIDLLDDAMKDPSICTNEKLKRFLNTPRARFTLTTQSAKFFKDINNSHTKELIKKEKIKVDHQISELIKYNKF